MLSDFEHNTSRERRYGLHYDPHLRHIGTVHLVGGLSESISNEAHDFIHIYVLLLQHNRAEIMGKLQAIQEMDAREEF